MGRTRRRRKSRPLAVPNSDHILLIEFQKWLALKNLQIKVVETSSSGRGIIAKRTISPGDNLLLLPLSKMVTMGVVNSSFISTKFHASFSPTVSVALWLVYEKHIGELSTYYPYLQILPKKFDCLFLCSQEEGDALPEWMKKPINDKLKEAKEDYDSAYQILASEKCRHCELNLNRIYTYEAFLWAWTCVNTRCVYYEDESISDTGEKITSSSIALAPLLDFFNHSNCSNVEAKLDYLNGVYLLKTNDTYKRNNEIFIKYGAFSNLKLLVEYGFMQDDEDQDVVEFKFEEVVKAAKMVDPFYGDISKLKYKFITYNNLHVNLSKSKDEFSWNCRGLLYILVTRDDNLTDLLSKTYSSTYSEKECKQMEFIQRKIIELKQEELLGQLLCMQKLSEVSRGFSMAKKLVEMYLRILNS